MPRVTTNNDTITQGDTERATVRLDGLSMVVVDDNKDTCEVLKLILTNVGADVQIAQSVTEALTIIEETKPDIILTDLAMPGESGIVLIDRLRNSVLMNSKVPIIVLSACAFEADRDEAMKAGANLFMAKPFKPSEIIQTVRQLALTSALQA
jgi:CheY-like chemotaxis protein